MRDDDIVTDMKDPKPSLDRQIFSRIVVGVDGNITQPMRPIWIDKRPRERMRARVYSVELVKKVTKLEIKGDNLEYTVGLVYKMLKAKLLGVGIEEVEIPTHPIEVHEKALPLLEVDPTYVASFSGIPERVDEFSERIDSVIWDLNIPIDLMLEEESIGGKEILVGGEKTKDEIRVEPIDTTEARVEPMIIEEAREKLTRIDVLAPSEQDATIVHVGTNEGGLESLEHSPIDSFDI